METASIEATAIRSRNNKEKSTWRIIDVLSILKVESTSKFPRWIDVIISTWIIRLSNSMKSRQTFNVEFRRRINDESTKMCPLGFLGNSPIYYFSCTLLKIVVFSSLTPSHLLKVTKFLVKTSVREKHF